MKVKVVIIGVIFSTVFAYSNIVLAGKILTVAEAKALFTNKTYDVQKEKGNKQFKVYSSADGTYNKKKKNGNIRKGKWRIVSKGNHCVIFKKEKCSEVVSAGNGVYHKMTNGKHTHTLKNFVTGNKL